MKKFAFVALSTILAMPALGALQAESTNTVAVQVLDGDTFNAEIDGVVQRVRMLGINATEIGTCHAAEATDYLEARIEGKSVRLTAEDPAVRSLGRPARFVDLGTADIGAEMLTRGLVMPYTHATETARNAPYLEIAAQARAAQIGIWNPTACGSGPYQDIDLQLGVRWDGELDENIDVNGEWIDIYNPSNSTLSLDGWHVRDSATRFYYFKSGTEIAPKSYVRVHIGVGTDDSVRKYWGLTRPIFANDLADAAYLFDPDGDLRDSFEYPCQLDCVNQFTGLTLQVNYNPPGNETLNPNSEYIDVLNSTNESVNLYGLYVELFPYAYHFEPQHSIPALGSIRIRVGTGSDTPSTLYWGKNKPLLSNAGGAVTLERKDGLVLEEFRWPIPGVSCTQTPGTSILTTSGSGTNADASVSEPATALARAKRIGQSCD